MDRRAVRRAAECASRLFVVSPLVLSSEFLPLRPATQPVTRMGQDLECLQLPQPAPIRRPAPRLPQLRQQWVHSAVADMTRRALTPRRASLRLQKHRPGPNDACGAPSFGSRSKARPDARILKSVHRRNLAVLLANSSSEYLLLQSRGHAEEPSFRRGEDENLPIWCMETTQKVPQKDTEDSEKGAGAGDRRRLLLLTAPAPILCVMCVFVALCGPGDHRALR